MANTILQVKKSGVTGNVPSSLAFGELALNYADGKLYYKAANGLITFIQSDTTTDSFATINANSSLILATSPTDTLSIAAGNNITISACTTTKTITINSQDADIDQFARNQANSALTLAQDAYNYANTISGGAAIDNVARSLAQSAYDKANLAITFAQASYDQSNVTIGVDATQNTRLNSIETINNEQNTSINIIQGVDTWQNTQITSINQFTQSAYNQANTKANLFGYTANTILVANATGYISNSNLFFTLSNNTLIVPGAIVGGGANTTIGANGFVTTFDTTGAVSFPGIVYIANTNISAFANTISANTIITQGVDATQNTRLNSIETINNEQNTAISIIQGVNLTQNTNITAVNNFAQSSYNTANGANGLAQGAYDYANTQVSIIAGINDTQNTRLNSIETVNNNQNTSISIIQGVDLWQNTQITYVNQFAQAAYDKANTGGGGTGSTAVISDDNSSNNVFYVNFTANTSGNLNVIQTSSANLTYTPSTGTLSVSGLNVTPNTSINSKTMTVNSETVIDSLPTSLYRSAFYQIQLELNELNFHVLNLNVLQNNSGANTIVYGEIYDDFSLGTFSASVSSGYLNVIFTPTSSGTQLTFLRSAITKSGTGVPSGSLGFVTQPVIDIIDAGYTSDPVSTIYDYGNLS